MDKLPNKISIPDALKQKIGICLNTATYCIITSNDHKIDIEPSFIQKLTNMCLMVEVFPAERNCRHTP